jgi:hypothetical protein
MKSATRLLAAALLSLVTLRAWSQAVVFTCPPAQTGYVGVAFGYHITAVGEDSFDTPINLPAGLQFTSPMIFGTPLAVGTNVVTLTARDYSDNPYTTNVTFTILAATPSPRIDSATTDFAIVGQLYTYQILATNVTVDGYTATPLPAWLSLDPETGELSGTPEVVGSATLTLTAFNATSLPGSTNLTITIQPTSVATTTNVIFQEGFESNFPAAWQVGDARAAGTPAYWSAVDAPFGGASAASGSRMAYCAGVGYAGTSSSPTYRSSMAAYLQRTVDLTGAGAATLSFQSYVRGIEAGFDFCRVLVNGNKVWEKSSVDSDWTYEVLPLNDYAGNSAVTIRFEFDSDDNMNSTGWFLDDIKLGTAGGDAFDRATEISRGTNHTGSVASPNALDTCRVTLRKGYRYVITASPGTLIDTQLWLFDVSRNQLAYNDDDPQGGLGSRITYTCGATGDFYLQVGGVAGATGSYTLLVAEQAASADIQALSVEMALPDDDPRGLNPDSLDFTLQNNGPFGLDNGETYDYQIEVYLSATNGAAGTGVRIGGESIELAIAAGDSEDFTGVATLTSYTIPDTLTGGTFRVWLHVTPLSGSPTDARMTNNWVAGGTVVLPPLPTVTLSGTITKSGGTSGMPGVPVVLVSADRLTTNTVTTDSYGAYTLSVTNGWSGTVTPSNTVGSGVFVPAARVYTNVTASLSSQNYGWGAVVTIAGSVTRSDNKAGLAGVTLTFSGVGAVATDGSGSYIMSVPSGWSGTATASYGSGGFAKPSKNFSKVTSNKTKQNFEWTPDPVVSGSVVNKATKGGVAGVTLTFSGVGTATTDGSGNYSRTVPYGWTGTLTPSSGAGGTYSPASKSFSKLKKDKDKQKFTWTAPAAAAVPAAATLTTSAKAMAAAEPVRLLHATGTIRWTGPDALQARQSADLVHIGLADGGVKMDPSVPVGASGELTTTVEFLDGLPAQLGLADGDLVVIRNQGGVAVAVLSLPDVAIVDNILLLTSGDEVILTWDLLLLRL